MKVRSHCYQRYDITDGRLVETETRSQSDSNDDVERERRKHKKRRHKHNTGSISDDESDEGHSKRRRHKKSKRKDRSRSHSRAKEVEDNDRKRTGTPEEETEEQYDARLEREEKERLEEQRRKELERLKRLKEDVPTTNGVRFKGMSNVAMLLGTTHTRIHRSRKNEVHGSRASTRLTIQSAITYIPATPPDKNQIPLTYTAVFISLLYAQ